MKAQHFAVGFGELSGRINAGLVDKTGKCFTSKEDCTDMALIAVAVYTLRQGGDVTVTDDIGNTVHIHAEPAEGFPE